MLIVSLPLNPNAEVDHLVCATPEKISHSARSRVGELAHLAQHPEVVGVIPWQCLSWINLNVPQNAVRWFETKTPWLTPLTHTTGTQHPKAQNLVLGLLEEHLLGEASDVHWIAKTLDSSQSDPALANMATLQVGYCSKSWLRESLKALESVNLIPQQLVPEIEPCAQLQGPTLFALNAQDDLTFVLSTPQGVQAFPRAAMAGFSQLKDPKLTVFAEPSTIDLVSSLIFERASLQTTAQRLWVSSQSAWDFARGEWDQGPVKKAARQLKSALHALWSAPQWKLARLGVAMALLVQIVGLNWWAWHLKSVQQETLQNEAKILQSTFPNVRLVVDARLQMKRELNALRQNSGEPSPGDFEHLLVVMRDLHSPSTSSPNSSSSPPSAPDTREIQSIDYSSGTLKWHYKPSVAFTSLQLQLSPALVSQGYQLKKTDADMVLSWSDDS